MVRKTPSSKVAKKSSVIGGCSSKTVAIFRYVVIGFSQDKICRKFNIEPVTLRKHKKNFRDKKWMNKISLRKNFFKEINNKAYCIFERIDLANFISIYRLYRDRMDLKPFFGRLHKDLCFNFKLA